MEFASGERDYAFAVRRRKRREAWTTKRRSRNRPLDGACLGRQLDGIAVKEKRKPPKTSRMQNPPLPRWFAGVFARRRNLAKTIDERFVPGNAAA